MSTTLPPRPRIANPHGKQERALLREGRCGDWADARPPSPIHYDTPDAPASALLLYTPLTLAPDAHAAFTRDSPGPPPRAPPGTAARDAQDTQPHDDMSTAVLAAPAASARAPAATAPLRNHTVRRGGAPTLPDRKGYASAVRLLTEETCARPTNQPHSSPTRRPEEMNRAATSFTFVPNVPLQCSAFAGEPAAAGAAQFSSLSSAVAPLADFDKISQQLSAELLKRAVAPRRPAPGLGHDISADVCRAPEALREQG